MLYITSWEEKSIGETFHRSWKGYSFDILNELSDEDLIWGSKKSKSVTLSPEAVEQAKQLMQKYNITD